MYPTKQASFFLNVTFLCVVWSDDNAKQWVDGEDVDECCGAGLAFNVKKPIYTFTLLYSYVLCLVLLNKINFQLKPSSKKSRAVS